MKILQVINQDFIEPLIIETDNYLPSFIQFEAVSGSDHLNEKTTTRGTQCTSIDALMYTKHKNGSKWLVLIEWKYVESYTNLDKSNEIVKKEDGSHNKGDERQRRYNNLIKNSSQLIPNDLKCFYFELFYQLMRQTLWADQMILHKEIEKLKADDYTHVHVIPPQNVELLNKIYKCSNLAMEDTWRSLLKDNSKYNIIPPQILLDGITKNPKYTDLYNYLSERYWV